MEHWIVALFLFFFSIEILVEFVLNELNLRYVRARWAEKNISDIFRGRLGAEEYDKSVAYTLAKGRFQRWAAIYEGSIVLAVLFSGALPFLDQITARLGQAIPLGGYAHGILFCFGIGLLFSVAGLVTDAYSTFALEGRFGFNNTSASLYIADKLKALLLGVAIGTPFLWVVLWLMDAMGPLWWIWAFVFITSFQLLMIVIFPTFIAPWFNKFEPLKEGEWRERILKLAERVGFQTSGIYVMDGSKRSSHSNAYFTGIGKSKRIVLFDTLVEQMSIEQGLAVLAHEMGHYKMRHIQRMLIVQTVFSLIGLYVVSLLLDYRPLYAAFALEPSHHAALVLFSLLAGPLTFVLGPILNLLSRRHEYEADCFAVTTLHNPKPMEEALITLTLKNWANLTPHPWYSAYHYSHPSPVERIEALRHCPV
jgi:STE24 endopeptidase